MGIRVVTFILTFVFAALVGCSAKNPAPDILSPKPGDNRPFTVKIDKEYFDGKRLYVAPVIESRERWSTARVSIVLKAFRDGNLIRERVIPLAQIAPYFEQGERREIPIILEVEEPSDYQVELLWGDESGITRESSGVSKIKLTLINSGVKSKTCYQDRCSLVPYVEVSITNLGEFSLKNISLQATSLAKDLQKLALSQSFTQNTERVNLANLTLAPGEARTIRLVLQEVVISPGEAVENYLNYSVTIAEAEELSFERSMNHDGRKPSSDN